MMKSRKIISPQRLSSFLNRIVADSRTSSVLLIACMIFSMALSALPFMQDAYVAIWNSRILALHALYLPSSILEIIDDCLMPLFFFTVGYEIKHELYSKDGSVNTLKKAIMPLIAALGGVLMPAFLFSLVNRGSEFSSGWAIPTATDIAFSLAVISLIANAIPNSLKILLMTLAIFDDLIAIVIIALFYGQEVRWIFFIPSFALPAALYFLYKKRRALWIKYTLSCLLCVGIWHSVYLSGIHPTLSGIIIIFIMPFSIGRKIFNVLTPLVKFVILPLFVLANTAIPLNATAYAYVFSPLSIGIFVGLLVGKPLGIALTTLISSRLHIAHLPKEIKMRHVVGVGIIAGIGFTMSMFIASLSFGDRAYVDAAKLSIIIASILAAALGIAFLKISTFFFEKHSRKQRRDRTV